MFQNIKFSEQRGITGNHFFDYASCITRLWIADRGLFAGTENEHINIGKFIDETSKPRLRKSLIIQGLCSIDYIEENDIVEVHEIKKGKNPSFPHILQLLFYLEIIYEFTGVEPIGILHLPQSKNVKRISRDREKIVATYYDILKIVNGECPEPKMKPICSGCRFSEMCWA